MAFFGIKKEATQKKKTGRTRPTQRTFSVEAGRRNLSTVLVRPHVTEKSAKGNDHGVYTFLIRRDATKYDVRDAVVELFKVTPRKVTIVNQSPRTTHSRARGREISVAGLKKANVFLNKGDRIDLI